MQAAQITSFLPVEDYLADELQSKFRHEYLGGAAYVMTVSTSEHNLIIGNLYSAWRTGLRGGPCRIYAIDLKVRL